MLDPEVMFRLTGYPVSGLPAFLVASGNAFDFYRFRLYHCWLRLSWLRYLWPALAAAVSDATFELQRHMFCGKICGLSAESSAEPVVASQVI